MNQQKKIIRKIKPCDIDVHFKYKCSNEECGIEHWLLLNEARTKNFKVVCECGNIYIPKRVSKLLIKYANSTTKKTDTKLKLSSDILKTCISILQKYGFDKKESEKLIQKAFEQSGNTETGSLIKLALQLFGDNNNV
jgi:hypothetical protein